jgi:HSP20 family molecular chaperone IbpA
MEDNAMTEETLDLQVQDTEKREVAETEGERTRDRPAFVPRADIYETDQEIVVVADMPGVDEKSVDITLENNVLTISGEVDLTPPAGQTLSFAEYQVGDYQRAFALSDQIEREEISATVKDGVLRLHLPKITEARVKKIAITAG